MLSRGECLLTHLSAVPRSHSCSESSLFHWSLRLRRGSRNENQAVRRPSRHHLWPGAGSEGGWEQKDNYMFLSLSSLALSWSELKQQQPLLTIHFSESLTPCCPRYLSFQNLCESEFSFGPEFWLPCPDVLAQTFTSNPPQTPEESKATHLSFSLLNRTLA